MAYLGNPPAEAYTNTVKDSFNGDGSTTAFTLSQPSTTNNLRVVVENVIQDPTVAYSCIGTTLTFTSAPPSGTANIYAVHLGPAVMTAVPPTEITNATTYTSALTVQGAFTSPGIDDNATSTAMTLDSSGNLLVGKTASNATDVGIVANANGRLYATVNGDTSIFNRTSSDGSILDFRKDGTTVGGIGTFNGDTVIGTGQAAFRFNDGLPSVAPHRMDTNNVADNLVDLGYGSGRWKNLYLSGGVYLGGTASSNLIDIYEEGSWTPSLYNSSGSSISASTLQGRYTKIGNMITIWVYIWDISGAFQTITGFPAADTSSVFQGVGSIVYAPGGGGSAPHSAGPKVILLTQGSTQLKMDSNYFSGSNNIWMTMNYRAP